ncbi:MAG TPA: flagellar basal body rod protein FlgC [Negativicutes bacterium]|nr:flagellar basal body rod protein FlgC [Negativicutes bacterium]
MRIFRSMDIAASGLTAERLRMDIIANNIANAASTRTEDGGPYRRQMPVFAPREAESFSSVLNRTQSQMDSEGVRVVGITKDAAPFKKVYNPHHPDADKDGYVNMPNVDTVTEMVDMISASRSYEANVTVINAAKSMALKALEIGKG